MDLKKSGISRNKAIEAIVKIPRILGLPEAIEAIVRIPRILGIP